MGWDYWGEFIQPNYQWLLLCSDRDNLFFSDFESRIYFLHIFVRLNTLIWSKFSGQTISQWVEQNYYSLSLWKWKIIITKIVLFWMRFVMGEQVIIERITTFSKIFVVGKNLIRQKFNFLLIQFSHFWISIFTPIPQIL